MNIIQYDRIDIDFNTNLTLIRCLIDEHFLLDN